MLVWLSPVSYTHLRESLLVPVPPACPRMRPARSRIHGYWQGLQGPLPSVAKKRCLDVYKRQGVSYAFQTPVRFKGLTVRDLVELAAGGALSEATLCELLGKVGLCAREYMAVSYTHLDVYKRQQRTRPSLMLPVVGD